MNERHEILSTLEANSEVLKASGVRSIGLFGSMARGDATSTSDLDFIVDLKLKTFDAYMDVKEMLEKWFGRSVDLVLDDAVKPVLRERIRKETVHAAGF